MLKEKLKKDDVIVFRTVGSDEVICKLVEESQYNFVVSKPLALAMGPNGAGMTAYMLMADADAEFVFDKKVIITVAKANKQAAEVYTQSTSKIVQPPKQSIIT
jgi:hypothetical protein